MTTAFSGLAIPLDTPPMEAKLASGIPAGAGWQFEPKWDGFRCLAFRDGDAAEVLNPSNPARVLAPLETLFSRGKPQGRKSARPQRSPVYEVIPQRH